MNPPNGAVVYEGPSKLGPDRVVVVLTGVRRPSVNVKTGAMVQSWILLRDVAPHDAARVGDDVSICGDCELRGEADGVQAVGRSCYVRLSDAPLSVWRAYRRGRYPRLPPGPAGLLLTGKALRIGAYGDPAAVPTRVWVMLLRHVRSWTGYTRQWPDPQFHGLRRFLMASVQSPEERAQAQARGWRTYRVAPTAAADPGEIVCPASKEAGRRTTCERCRLCAGAGPTKSIVIAAHGPARVTLSARLAASLTLKENP